MVNIQRVVINLMRHPGLDVHTYDMLLTSLDGLWGSLQWTLEMLTRLASEIARRTSTGDSDDEEEGRPANPNLPLPPGWRMEWSREYNVQYYFHVPSGDSMWERPTG